MKPIPPPIPSPAAPGSGADPSKPSTGEFAALQVEAKKEDVRRSPVTHWDLVKSNIAVIGTLVAIVLGFIAFGDRVVARAESKTTDAVATGVKVTNEKVSLTNEALTRHIDDSRIVHAEIRDAVHELTVEVKEFRKDARAIYRAMPAKHMQSRLEVDVIEPEELEFRVPLVAGPTRSRDGGR